MPKTVFRQAVEADLETAAEMYARLDGYFRQLSYHFPPVEDVGSLWVDSFRRTMGRFSILYVAERENHLLGFSLGRIKRVAPYLGGMMVGELSDIWVDPQVRRSQVGHKLAQMTFDWLGQQGVDSIEVQVLEGNQASLDFFRSFGFQPELRQLRLPLMESEDA